MVLAKDILDPKSPSVSPLALNMIRRVEKLTRTAGLDLCDIFLPEPKLFVEAQHVLSD